jgi:hypothetical protein
LLVTPPSTKSCPSISTGENSEGNAELAAGPQPNFIQYDLFARFNIRPNAQKRNWQLVEVSM